MTYEIVFEPTAEEGIRQAVRWITANSTPTAAAKWYDGLIEAVYTL